MAIIAILLQRISLENSLRVADDSVARQSSITTKLKAKRGVRNFERLTFRMSELPILKINQPNGKIKNGL